MQLLTTGAGNSLVPHRDPERNPFFRLFQDPKNGFYDSSNNSRSRGIRIKRRQDDTDVSVIEESAGLGSN